MSLEIKIREIRDNKLNECDKWLQVPILYATITEEQEVVLLSYMQELRDWPKKDPQDNTKTLPVNTWNQPVTPSFEECGVKFK